MCRLAGRPCAPIGLGFQCSDGVELWWSAFGRDGVAGGEGLGFVRGLGDLEKGFKRSGPPQNRPKLRDVAFLEEPVSQKRFHGNSLRRCYPNPWETLKRSENLNVLCFRRFPQTSHHRRQVILTSCDFDPMTPFFSPFFFGRGLHDRQLQTSEFGSLAIAKWKWVHFF